MSFLDVSSPHAVAILDETTSESIVREAVAALPRPPASFDPFELQVMRLARMDGLASLREPTRLDKFLALIFGPSFNRRLASERLEALRRLSVEAWHHGYAVRRSAIAAFLAAGFSPDQLELLLGTISKGRSARGRRSFA